MDEVLRWIEQRLKKEVKNENEKINNANTQKEKNPVTNNETSKSEKKN
jgi:hypothetical protein